MLDYNIRILEEYKDVHKASMQEDGSDVSPDLVLAEYIVIILSSTFHEHSYIWSQELCRVKLLVIRVAGKCRP